jgi:hypothetical protein
VEFFASRWDCPSEPIPARNFKANEHTHRRDRLHPVSRRKLRFSRSHLSCQPLTYNVHFHATGTPEGYPKESLTEVLFLVTLNCTN